MNDIDLSEDNIDKICRLCLKTDDFVIDIFHGLEGQSKKDNLPEQINELYKVKVEENDGLPKNICHRCLYLTESFTSFRLNVKYCEKKLKEFSQLAKTMINDRLLGISSSKQEKAESHYEGINGFHNFVPDQDCEVTVVDPNQEYDSSDDCFSMDDSDTVFTSPTKKIINEAANDIPVEKSSSVVQHYIGLKIEPKNAFLCQYCDMAFTTQMNCDEHESRHDAANPFICNFCPFRTENRQVLIHHIKESHDKARPFVCSLCNKGFCRRSDLKKHTIVHTGVRPFSCAVCSKSFSRNTNLTKHMRIHSGIKPHVCQQCPRSFTTFADLIRHQRAHSEIKPHKCTKCQSSFTRKDKLQKHYLSHLRKESKSTINEKLCFRTNQQYGRTEANPKTNLQFITDNVQPAATTTISDLSGNCSIVSQDQIQTMKEVQPENTRFKLKSNVKVHFCNICSRTFRRLREFQRHQALHLDSLYKCNQCDKNFNRRDKLLRHERVHHTEQYHCNQCEMSYSKLEALQMHAKVHGLQNNFSSNVESVPSVNDFSKQAHIGLGFYSEIKSDE